MTTTSQEPSFVRSLRHAWEGLCYVSNTQRNFRVHLLVASFVVVAGWSVHLTRVEWLVLVLTVGQVLFAEIVNTAAETIMDLVSPTYHPLAKRTKDVAAGAVLLTASIAVVIGIILFAPSLLALLRDCL